MLLHNVSKIERLTERETTRTSRFIPALRRRAHSKRSAVSSDTYSGESILVSDNNNTNNINKSFQNHKITYTNTKRNSIEKTKEINNKHKNIIITNKNLLCTSNPNLSNTLSQTPTQTTPLPNIIIDNHSNEQQQPQQHKHKNKQNEQKRTRRKAVPTIYDFGLTLCLHFQSLDYAHTKTSATTAAALSSSSSVATGAVSASTATATASSSSSSSTNIIHNTNGGTQASSTKTTIMNNSCSSSSSKKKERSSFLGYTRAHYRKASLDEKDSVGSGSNSGSSIGKIEQRSSVDISILLTDDEESSNSRISDTGSMSLTTITDTLDSKLRNLRSGSESNDENCSPEFPKNRRHTLGQPLHLHSENIPYADESPERHFHATHPLDVITPKSYMLSRTCTADAKAVLERHLAEKPIRALLTPGALTYKNHKLQHSATVPINSTSGIGSLPVAASTPTSLKNSTNITGNSGSGTARNLSMGKNLRFSSSVYEHCCSEDDSEGSTTSDPKESSLIINSPSYLLDRYNKKRRDHRLFRSASFNCRNYSTRHNHVHMHGGNACTGISGGNNSSCGTPTTSLTKDEKTDMNLTKKRQIQNKQNRSIKRRHTVGGPHDYANNSTTPRNTANSMNTANGHHSHKNGSSLARRLPLGNANGNNNSNNNNNNNNNNINNASSDNGNSSAGSSGAGDGVDGSSSGVSSGGNDVSNATNRATVAVAAPGGDHVLELGIRIKNLNRGRY